MPAASVTPNALQCPQCGAALQMQNAATVVIVCGSCRSMVTRDAEGARRVGSMAELVEDGSAIQLGTQGSCGRRRFRVIGRLRLRYDDGEWNEWFVAFGDGRTGWLSDASAQYVVTEPLPGTAALVHVPSFATVEAGQPIKVADTLYLVSDVRTAHCVGGEGELPMAVGEGWQARVVDARRGTAFVTVDYTDDAPVAYVGVAGDVDFDAATLRAREQVMAAAIGYRGDLVPLACPQCGGSITVVAALATQVICPYCGSELDCSGPRTEILQAARRVADFRPTLALGSRGTFDGIEYTLIGAMRCSVPGDSSEAPWTEYLLFSARKGYLWVVETLDAWQIVQVCDAWPTDIDESGCRWGGRAWRRGFTYRARVDAVFGAFNWRVRRGDLTHVVEYTNAAQTLNREATREEVTWSAARNVSSDFIRRAFKLPVAATRRTPARPPHPSVNAVEDDTDLVMPAVGASLVVMLLNDAITPVALFLGLALIWAPIALHYWSND